MAGGEFDRDGSAGVTPIGGGVFDAERGERFGERVGEVLDARLQDRQLVGQADPGRVEGEAGETLAKNRQQRSITLAEQGDACSIASAGPLPARR